MSDTSSKKLKQAGWLYTFFFPNSAAKYNEDQRKLKRKGDDVKLQKIYKLVFDIENHNFYDACRTVMSDRGRAKIKSTEGFLPLHLAVYERSPKNLLELLIEAYPGALKERDPKGLLPIHIASRDPTILIDIIQLLVKCYPPALKETDPIGDLPTHSSIRYHLPKEMTLEFLNFYPESLDICDKQGNTLVMMALRFEASFELVKDLLKRRPDTIKTKNAHGDLPFHRACLFHSSLEVLEFLLALWPESMFERDAQGNYPIHLYFMQCKGGRPVESTMHFFLDPFPASIGMKNAAKCTPFEVLDSYHEQLEAYAY